MPSQTSLDFSNPVVLFFMVQDFFGQKNLARRLDVGRKTLGRWEKQPGKLPVARQLALKELLRSIPSQDSDSADFTFVDLFAGIGDIQAGLRQLMAAACSPASGIPGRRRLIKQTMGLMSPQRVN
jgi:hypothetical protein